MPHHELKILPPFYDDVNNGVKTFELRKNDRNFKVLQEIELREWDGVNYTGRFCLVDITYILKEFVGLEKNYCILGIKKV